VYMEIQFKNFAHKNFLTLASGGSYELEKNVAKAFLRHFSRDNQTHKIEVTSYYPCTTRIKVEYTDNGKPFRCFLSMSNYDVEDVFDIKQQKIIEDEASTANKAPAA
jgi:hypothetical protein